MLGDKLFHFLIYSLYPKFKNKIIYAQEDKSFLLFVIKPLLPSTPWDLVRRSIQDHYSPPFCIIPLSPEVVGGDPEGGFFRWALLPTWRILVV